MLLQPWAMFAKGPPCTNAGVCSRAVSYTHLDVYKRQAVAEVVCETVPVPVLRVGVNDTFGKSGPALELLNLYGLNAAHIVEAAKEAVRRKAEGLKFDSNNGFRRGGFP